MCGIAGLIRREGQPDAARLLSMLRAMNARGPDSGGQFSAPGIELGMRRLAILDVAGGDQPMHDASGQITAICNGEIYSYLELRKDLEAAGARFRTGSDAEILAHGYAEWGLDGLLTRLDGMFAFAIHDARTREIHLARDGSGIKPLLYAARGNAFAFASSYAALLASGLVSLHPDADAVRSFLHLQFVPGCATLLRDVRRLAPGHTLSLRDGVPGRPRAFWSAPHPAAGATPSGRAAKVDVRAWHKRVRSTWQRAIERHLRSDVEVGVFLSGGFDSSLVLAEASKLRGGGIRSFAIAMDAEGAWDESEHARAAAARFGSELEVLRFGPQQIAEILPGVGALMDEALGDAACLPTLLLAQFASRELKVVLTGEGADELFAGYDYYAGRLECPSTARSSLRAKLRGFKERIAPTRAWHGGCSEYSGFPYSLHDARIEELTPEFRTRRASARQREREAKIAAETKSADALSKALRVDASSWLPDDLLVKLDRATMAFSLEGRVPFLDRELVELAYEMPSELKRDAARGKAILRDAFAEEMGPLASRAKHGFDLPMADWIRGDLRELFDARLSSDGLAACPWLDAHAVRGVLDAHIRKEASLERALWSLYSLAACFEFWSESCRLEPRAAREPRRAVHGDA